MKICNKLATKWRLDLSRRNCQSIAGLGTEAGSTLDAMGVTQLVLFSHLKLPSTNTTHSDNQVAAHVD